MDANPKPTQQKLYAGSITLVPAGGLGNRMKAIAAALRLAQAVGSKLHIKWFRDWGLGCRFDQLFQPISHDSVTLDEATLTDHLFFDRPRRRNFYFPKIALSSVFDRTMDEAATTRGMREGFDFARWARGKRVWMSSNVYFMAEDIPLDAFDIFHPTPRLQARIDKEASALGENAVGVHIRRTDNARSIAQSPTEMFVQRMRQESPETRFYVATDDESVKQLLHQEFPQRIQTLPRQAQRGTLQGMEDAVVEMFLLSRCKRLIGSSCSTYSMTAAALGRIPLETIERKQS